MAERVASSATEPSGPRELVPEFFSTDNGVGLPVIDPSAPFIYAHHRRRFVVLLGKVVPELAKIPLVSGCNRVLKAPDGRIRFADCQSRLQERHWKIIPPALAPNGRTYLQEVDTLLPNGTATKAVISCWETAHAGEAHTAWDMPAYVDWLESLVTNGHIAPITPHRAGEMLGIAKSQLAKAELRLSSGKASSAERVKALKAEVAALEKAAKARGAPVAGKEVGLEGGS